MHRPILVCLVPFLFACSSLQFQETSLVDTAYDPTLKATRLKVQFQVNDSAGLPVSDIEPEKLTLREDGIPISREAMLKTTRQQQPMDVAILLDRSHSTYETGLIARQKELAKRLAKGLEKHPVRVHFYSFATSLLQLRSADELAERAPKDAEHWTSLYNAVQQALDRHPSGIVVVFSDGADTYSHNVGGPELGKLTDRISADKRIVHAIGLGNVEQERDLGGNNGATALRRMTVYGSFTLEAKPAAEPAPAATGEKEAVEASASKPAKPAKPAEAAEIVDPMVTEVARRIPTTYTCEFYSPRLSGEHSLQIDAERSGVSGTSPKIKFTGAGPAAAPEAGKIDK